MFNINVILADIEKDAFIVTLVLKVIMSCGEIAIVRIGNVEVGF